MSADRSRGARSIRQSSGRTTTIARRCMGISRTGCSTRWAATWSTTRCSECRRHRAQGFRFTRFGRGRACSAERGCMFNFGDAVREPSLTDQFYSLYNFLQMNGGQTTIQQMHISPIRRTDGADVRRRIGAVVLQRASDLQDELLSQPIWPADRVRGTGSDSGAAAEPDAGAAGQLLSSSCRRMAHTS